MGKMKGVVRIATANKETVMDILKLQEDFTMINIRIDVSYGRMFDTMVDYRNLTGLGLREFLKRFREVINKHDMWKLIRES